MDAGQDAVIDQDGVALGCEGVSGRGADPRRLGWDRQSHCSGVSLSPRSGDSRTPIQAASLALNPCDRAIPRRVGIGPLVASRSGRRDRPPLLHQRRGHGCALSGALPTGISNALSDFETRDHDLDIDAAPGRFTLRRGGWSQSSDTFAGARVAVRQACLAGPRDRRRAMHWLHVHDEAGE